MYMAAAALSQPLRWMQEREDEYMRRIGGYDKKIQDLFPKMFAEIVEAYEQEGCVDILGGMYMELELSNHWKGQFFTPDCVCRMMAEMQFHDTAELIEQQGYITVNDPTCGGGAMLIAFANVCKEKDVNFQHDVLFIGQDIDPVVARMCYISMSLLGMPGYVTVGNTLLMDTQNWDYWYTPMYFIHGFQWRRQRGNSIESCNAPDNEKSNTERAPMGGVPAALEVTTENLPKAIDAPKTEYVETKMGQLTLF